MVLFLSVKPCSHVTSAFVISSYFRSGIFYGNKWWCSHLNRYSPSRWIFCRRQKWFSHSQLKRFFSIPHELYQSKPGTVLLAAWWIALWIVVSILLSGSPLFYDQKILICFVCVKFCWPQKYGLTAIPILDDWHIRLFDLEMRWLLYAVTGKRRLCSRISKLHKLYNVEYELENLRM